MKLLTTLFMALALLACNESSATNNSDMRAVYSGADGAFQMTMELSVDGDLRGETRGQDMWLLRVDGVNYFIIPDEDGDEVLDARIAGELMREVMPPEMIEMMNQSDAPVMELERAGEVTVNGRTGIGYRMPGAPEGNVPFVFSDDPELTRLQQAMAAQFQASMSMMPVENDMFRQMLELLNAGAPLRFSGADLESYELVDIKDSQFVLPREPLDRDASRELMVSRGMIPAEPMEMPTFPNETE